MPGESQRIVIYPDRAKLIRYAALYLVATPLMALVGILFLSASLPTSDQTQPGAGIVGVIVGSMMLLVGILIGTLLLLTLYRLLAPRPSVVVSEEGVLDGCSLIGGGMGLLRWSELEAIIPAVYRKGMAFVVLVPRDPPAVLARRGPLMRVFLRILNVTLPGKISLPEWLLSLPVSEVCQRIDAAYPQTIEANDILLLGDLPGDGA